MQKLTKRIILVLFLAIAIDCGFGIIYTPVYKSYGDRFQEDVEQLRANISSAYMNTYTDLSFVNTATEDRPMEIPEKYYDRVESKLGKGRLYAVMYADNSVNTYFGTPETDYDYYIRREEVPNYPRFPFLFIALLRAGKCPFVLPLVGIYAVVVVAIVACWYVCRRKKKASKETATAIQTDSKPDEVS